MPPGARRSTIVSRVIKAGGEWLSSLALEDLISKVAGVSEVAVIGVPDAKWGEWPLALVVPRAGDREAASHPPAPCGPGRHLCDPELCGT